MAWHGMEWNGMGFMDWPTLTRRCLQELQARSAYSTPAVLFSMRAPELASSKLGVRLPEVGRLVGGWN